MEHTVENNIKQIIQAFWLKKKIHEIRQIKVLGVNCQENEVLLYWYH